MVSGSGGRGLLESNASSASVAIGTHVVLLSFYPAMRLERLLLRLHCFYFALRAHLHRLYYFSIIVAILAPARAKGPIADASK